MVVIDKLAHNILAEVVAGEVLEHRCYFGVSLQARFSAFQVAARQRPTPILLYSTHPVLETIYRALVSKCTLLVRFLHLGVDYCQFRRFVRLCSAYLGGVYRAATLVGLYTRQGKTNPHNCL